jgi:hypothetical protein
MRTVSQTKEERAKLEIETHPLGGLFRPTGDASPLIDLLFLLSLEGLTFVAAKHLVFRHLKGGMALLVACGFLPNFAESFGP